MNTYKLGKMHKFRKNRKLEQVYAEERASLNRLSSILSEISSHYHIDYANLIEILKMRNKYISIPAAVFNNELGPLENVVYYLHIKYNLSQARIAGILNRDYTTIWVTLENARRKLNDKEYSKFIESADDSLLLPAELFRKRKLSVLESTCTHMKESFGYSYHKIASILGRDERTVWTAVNRARNKR
ncbi:hypothetical protein GF323_00760 [Candidatus Woesearchaeota archaeon]|nr:hypothetical protein [Candidatus Woesearchaeota archaeon]